MTRPSLLCIIALVTFFAVARPAAALLCIDIGFVNVPPVVTYDGGYDVYNPNEAVLSVTFGVRAFAAIVALCAYRVFLSSGNSGNDLARTMGLSGQPDLQYNVYLDANKGNILRSHNNANSSTRINGTFNGVAIGATNYHTIYWVVDKQQLLRSSTSFFQDTLTLSVRELYLFNDYEHDTAPMTFRAQVKSSIDLSLVQTGGAFNTAAVTQTVDFGTLAAGVSRSYDTVVRSNAGYKINMQSANKQRLVHEKSPAIGDSVPYDMTFGGQTKNLSSGNIIPVANSNNITPAAGDRFATTFTIGDMTGAEAAGQYKDVITVTVSAD